MQGKLQRVGQQAWTLCLILTLADLVRLAEWLACPPLMTMIKMVQTATLFGTSALRFEFDSVARLPKRLGSVWNCLWGQDMHYKDLFGSIVREGYCISVPLSI